MGGLAVRRLPGAWRAGVIGAASFALTGAASVLLAIWSRQPWPPALASVLILTPGLYLAWKAIPASARRTRGRRAMAWNPIDLGVHQVVGGGPLPPYIRRPHDDLLDALLDSAVPASRLVVIRGGSSTGKTRAACLAVTRGKLGRWRLEYPLDAGALSALLDAGIRGRTLLWLGELRQYTSGDDGGAAVLGRLARLLVEQDHVIAVTTMWHEHWDSYAAAARTQASLSQDRASAAGWLLARLPELTDCDPARVDATRGGAIDVPDAFTATEVIAAACASPVLAEAASAASHADQDGQLAQYLAGVPDLLNRHRGSGGNRYGQAIITAAMDAARLGHESPLPEALLLDAAPGYLDDQDRTQETSSWAGPALEWAAEPLRGAIRAVQPIAPLRGTDTVGYRSADYLDQYGRRMREHQIGPADLWDALVTHTTETADLMRLGRSAAHYRLKRYAAAFQSRAAAQGSALAAASLISLLRHASPGSVSHAACWTAEHASLDNAWDLAGLVNELHEAGASGAITTLLARHPAEHVAVDSPWGIARLLDALYRAGASDAAAALADRAAKHTSLDNPEAVARLLNALGRAGVSGAITLLLARHPARHVAVDSPWAVVSLLDALYQAGASDAVTVLADRAAEHTDLDRLRDVARLLDALRLAGARSAVTALADRAAKHASLDGAMAVADLLNALHRAGAQSAITALLARCPAEHASLDDPAGIADLLDALRLAGASDAAALADRAAKHTSLDNPAAVTALVNVLHQAGASDAIATLLARHPAESVSLDAAGPVARLLDALHQAGASGAITALLARHPAEHASLDSLWGAADLLNALHRIGASSDVTILADRAAEHASLNNPAAVARLLNVLRGIRAGGAIATLLARHPAEHAAVDDPIDVGHLLDALHHAGASSDVTILADRAAEHASLDDLGDVMDLMNALGHVGARSAVSTLAARADAAGIPRFVLNWSARPWPGREPDGTSAPPWNWQEPQY